MPCAGTQHPAPPGISASPRMLRLQVRSGIVRDGKLILVGRWVRRARVPPCPQLSQVRVGLLLLLCSGCESAGCLGSIARGGSTPIYQQCWHGCSSCDVLLHFKAFNLDLLHFFTEKLMFPGEKKIDKYFCNLPDELFRIVTHDVVAWQIPQLFAWLSEVAISQPFLFLQTPEATVQSHCFPLGFFCSSVFRNFKNYEVSSYSVISNKSISPIFSLTGRSHHYCWQCKIIAAGSQ